MAEPSAMQRAVEAWKGQADKMRHESQPLQTGGGGGTFDGMEARVKALEDDMKKILQDTAEIKGMLRAAPSAVDFGELKGRVNSLPTTAKVGTLLAIAVAVITIATRWADFVAVVQQQ